jgi:hypothetical protein
LRQRLVPHDFDGDRTSKRQERTDALTLYLSPFGHDDTQVHEQIFSVVIRMKSTPSAFVPVLEALNRLEINVLHCSSIDMGTSNHGEPARLLVRIPAPLGRELQEQSASLRTTTQTDSKARQNNPLDAAAACLIVLSKSWTSTNREEKNAKKTVKAVLEHAIERINGLRSKATNRSQRDVLVTELLELHVKIKAVVKDVRERSHLLSVLGEQNVDEHDLFLLNLLSSSAPEPSAAGPPQPRDYSFITVAGLLGDLLFAGLVLEPETLTSLQTPLHLRHSVDVHQPEEWGCFRDVTCDECKPPQPDPQSPEWFLLEVPDTPHLEHCSFATLTFYDDSHLLRVTFKNREEEIIALAANFRDKHGELIRLVKPLGLLNVDLRLIEPLRKRCEKDYGMSELPPTDRGILYELVGNIRSSKLSLFDNDSIARLIAAHMLTTGLPSDCLTELRVRRASPSSGPVKSTLSIDSIGPHETALLLEKTAKEMPSGARLTVTSTAAAQGSDRVLLSRTYHVVQSAGAARTLTCTVARPQRFDIEDDLLFSLMDTCWNRASVRQEATPQRLSATLLDDYATAIYGVTLLKRLLKIQGVLEQLQKESGTIHDALRSVFRKHPVWQLLRAVVVPLEHYIDEAYFTLACDYIPVVHKAGFAWQWQDKTMKQVTLVDLDQATAQTTAFREKVNGLNTSLAAIRDFQNADLSAENRKILNAAAQEIAEVCFSSVEATSSIAEVVERITSG